MPNLMVALPNIGGALCSTYVCVRQLPAAERSADVRV